MPKKNQPRALFSIQNWTTKIFLASILLLSAFLTFWNIDGSLMFLGDQGRDALVVSQIFKDNDPVFIGPVTSVGNMYLGPFYYYFMLPFLFITYPNPVGPAIGVGLMHIITVGLLFFITREMINTKTAILATLLYTFHSSAIELARFSWNPNIAPLFSLLTVFFMYKAWTKSNWYWVLVTVTAAILVQLHYITLLLAGIAGLSFIAKFYLDFKNKRTLKTYLKIIPIMGLVVFLFFLPLLLFDFKHNWLNAKAFAELLFADDHFVPQGSLPIHSKIGLFFQYLLDKFNLIFFKTTINTSDLVSKVLSGFLFLLTIFALYFGKKTKQSLFGINLILIVVILSALGLNFYQHEVYKHYIGFLFPLSSIILAFSLSLFYNLPKKMGYLLLVPSILLFLFLNIQLFDFADRDWSIYKIKATSQLIISHLPDDAKYNIVSLSPSGDLEGQVYRYYMSTSNQPPVKAEERDGINTLVIIDEEKTKKNVTALPIYEIVVFPDKNIYDQFSVKNGPIITILTKTE